MEKLSALRCLPRKTFVYLLCIIFCACAFYTLYINSSESYPSIQESYRKSHLESWVVSEQNKLDGKTSSLDNEKPNDQIETSALKVKPGTLFSGKNASHTTFQSIHNLSSSLPKSQNVSSVRYVYLQNSTTMTPIFTPTPDTCKTSNLEHSKLILLWTSFFGSWEYLGTFDHCSHCPNCRITKDRNSLSDSDAIVFHCRDLNVADLPPFRLPHQRWIFYCLESPSYSDYPGLLHVRNMFNWTMTYRADSDISSPYGTVAKVRPPQLIDKMSLKWTWSNKSRSIAWLSSHCPTEGGRDLYVKELRRHIDVDIYGSCGWASCPKGHTERCLQDFASKYHFFLAFENAICKDYITEKFFRTLKYDIIPVAFGGAEYQKFAPPGSFVDSLAFKSPKHLAFFLRGLSKDFKLYSSYFNWRQNYSIRMSNSKQCALCALLHKEVKPSSYKDLRKWWVDDANCKIWKPK